MSRVPFWLFQHTERVATRECEGDRDRERGREGERVSEFEVLCGEEKASSNFSFRSPFSSFHHSYPCLSPNPLPPIICCTLSHPLVVLLNSFLQLFSRFSSSVYLLRFRRVHIVCATQHSKRRKNDLDIPSRLILYYPTFTLSSVCAPSPPT